MEHAMNNEYNVNTRDEGLGRFNGPAVRDRPAAVACRLD